MTQPKRAPLAVGDPVRVRGYCWSLTHEKHDACRERKGTVWKFTSADFVHVSLEREPPFNFNDLVVVHRCQIRRLVKRQAREWIMNVYQGGATLYRDEEEADAAQSAGRIERVHVREILPVKERRR